MPTVLCDKRVTCPCTDSPVSNYSAEDPDAARHLARRYFRQRPKYGSRVTSRYIALGCMAVCYSEESQEAADDCALANAQQCVWDDWTDPNGNPYVFFCNNQMYCLAYCSDGSPFWKRQAPGTVCALSQAAANRMAYSRACIRARTNRMCITQSARQGCVNFAFSCDLTISGSHHGVYWAFTSALPAGLTWAATVNPNVIRISGTPTASGTHTATVMAFNSNGDYVTKTLSFRFLEITSPDILDEGTVNSDYAYQFTAAGGSGNYVWSLYDGILPDGLVLDPDGYLTGKPTTAASYTFTVQVCDLSF